MRSTRLTIRMLLVVVVAALALGCGSASAAWKTLTPSLPVGTSESRLTSVSCAGEICWAVGNYRHSGVVEPLALQTVSNTYGLPPSPGSSPELLDVSCVPNGGTCMAVGRYITGGVIQAFGEKWVAGTGWSLQTLTFPFGNTASELGSISCPTKTECVAVGDYHNATGIHYLAERWAGGSWASETPTEPAGIGFQALTAISCPAAEECFAVGEYRVSPYAPANQTMEGENLTAGPTWTPRGESFKPASGTVPFIGDNSCLSSKFCVGVGFYTTTSSPLEMTAWELIAALPGWKRQSMTALAEETSLHGVYCWSTKPLCLAVGRRQQFGTGTPLLEELVGPTWSQVTLPAPIGSSDNELGRVACIIEATLCSAVGHTVVSGATSALLERNF